MAVISKKSTETDIQFKVEKKEMQWALYKYRSS